MASAKCLRIAAPNLVMLKEHVAATRGLTLAGKWATSKKEELLPALQAKGSTVFPDGMRSRGRLVILLILTVSFPLRNVTMSISVSNFCVYQFNWNLLTRQLVASNVNLVSQHFFNYKLQIEQL
jgi:hypothetical protein